MLYTVSLSNVKKFWCSGSVFHHIYNCVLDVGHRTKCQTVEDIFAVTSGSSLSSRCCYFGGFGVAFGSVILGQGLSGCFALLETGVCACGVNP